MQIGMSLKTLSRIVLKNDQDSRKIELNWTFFKIKLSRIISNKYVKGTLFKTIVFYVCKKSHLRICEIKNWWEHRENNVRNKRPRNFKKHIRFALKNKCSLRFKKIEKKSIFLSNCRGYVSIKSTFIENMNFHTYKLGIGI